MNGEAQPAASGLTFQQRFASLQDEWRRSLPARLQDAQQRMQACRAAPADGAGLEELHRLLHTLAGSAGTFGLAALGAAARSIEHELDRVRTLPQRNGDDLDQADRALQALAATAPPS